MSEVEVVGDGAGSGSSGVVPSDGGVFFFFFFFYPPADRMGKNKALAHHTSTYFHTRRVDVTQLLSQPNASWRTLRIPL